MQSLFCDGGNPLKFFAPECDVYGNVGKFIGCVMLSKGDTYLNRVINEPESTVAMIIEAIYFQ